MEHKYSTYTIIGLFVVFLVMAIMAWDTGEVDTLCNDEGSMLIRLNGIWQCTTDLYVREDFRFPVEIIRQGASTEQPTFVTFLGNTEVLSFSPTQMQEGFVSIQMPHGRLDNSTLKPHWHWTPSSTNTGSVVWCVEYTCANINAVYPATSVQCTTDAGDGVVNKHQMTEMINITNTLEASSMCQMRIFRNATDTRDTFTGSAYLLEYDIHYTAKAVGEMFP